MVYPVPQPSATSDEGISQVFSAQGALATGPCLVTKSLSHYCGET